MVTALRNAGVTNINDAATKVADKLFDSHIKGQRIPGFDASQVSIIGASMKAKVLNSAKKRLARHFTASGTVLWEEVLSNLSEWHESEVQKIAHWRRNLSEDTMALRVESIEKVMAYWSRNLATTFHERGVHDPNLDLDGVRCDVKHFFEDMRSVEEYVAVHMALKALVPVSQQIIDELEIALKAGMQTGTVATFAAERLTGPTGTEVIRNILAHHYLLPLTLESIPRCSRATNR